MPTADTIAAVSTAPGRSLRSLLRISGPRALAAAANLEAIPQTGSTGSVRIRAGTGLPIPALASIFHAPNSFTGEDTVELLLVGNPLVVDSILIHAVSLDGLRPALPGEFSARAFLNGRLTLEQAEGIAALIGATQASHLRAATNLLTGDAGADFLQWAKQLAHMLALCEAGIDFSDAEDVVGITPDMLSGYGTDLAATIGAALAARPSSEVATAQPLVVLVGQPNAGKSTLFNALLGRPRSVASPTVGTTRDVITELLDLAATSPLAGTIQLADLPGFEPQTNSPSALASQRTAAEAVRKARCAIWCDPTGRFDVASLATIGVPELPKAVIRVQTFADQFSSHAAHHAIEVCGLDGYGLQPLRLAIADSVMGDGGDGSTLVVPRHRHAAWKVLSHLSAAVRIADSEPDPHRWKRAELAATELRLALDAAEELAGRMTPDEILGRVFSTFCIGK